MTTEAIQNPTIEAAVLGACMLRETAADLCCESMVTTAHFTDKTNAKVWETIKGLIADGVTPDLATVSQAGIDLNVLSAMVDKCMTVAHVQHYIDILNSLFMRRECIRTAHEILAVAIDDDNGENVRSLAEHSFATLAKERVKSEQAADVIAKQMEQWKLAQTTKVMGLTTGNASLDNYFGGLLPGALYIFSGEPGAGKTTLARNVCEHLAKNGEPVGVASLEQTAEFFWGSVVATRARQSLFRLNQGSDQVDWRAMERAEAEVKEWPILVDDRQQTLTSLTSWARRMVGKHGCKLLVLDYLQRITPEEKYDSDERRISECSMSITALAKTLKVAIICISSLSREGKLRGSGQLDYDAWAHIKLTKGDMAGNDVLIDVHYEKQRTGPSCDSEQWRILGDRQQVVCQSEDYR